MSYNANDIDRLDEVARAEARHASSSAAPTENEAGETFADWFAKVDRLLIAKVGIGANDGSDWPSYDTWNDGATPLDALQAWAEWQDLPEGLL